MRVAILADPSLEKDREFFEATFKGADLEAAFFDAKGAALPNLEGFDAVISSLEAVRHAGDVGSSHSKAHWVVASRFDRVLAPLRDRGIDVLALPCTQKQLLDAVRAPAGAAPQGPASADLAQIDAAWEAHDRSLAAAGLHGVERDARISSLAKLAATGVGTAIALVTIVDSQEQRFLGEHGLPNDLHAAGGTPREWSFCQHVVQNGATLVIDDAKANDFFKDTPLVQLGLVRAYAGVPVRVEGVGVVGAVCAISSDPRQFSKQDLATLELAARAVEASLPALQRVEAKPNATNPNDSVSIDVDAQELASAELRSIPFEAKPRAMKPASPPPVPARAGVNPASSSAVLVAPISGEVLVGSTIADRYVVTARLGQGGMAQVYLARDRELGRLVALKVLGGELDDRMLVHEARQLASIRHPCIVQLFDWGRIPGGRIYLVLEYVKGDALRDRVRSLRSAGKAMPPKSVSQVLRNLSGALETLHGAGLVHGDVKPGNVILDDQLDRAVLIDFGLTMHAADSGNLAGGTPGYSPPEQLDVDRPAAPDPSLDVYALGALAYVMLTGEGAFAGMPADASMRAQRDGIFSPVTRRRPELGPAMDAVFVRALAPSPADRYGSVTALVDALDEAFGARVTPGRRMSLDSMLAVVGGDDTSPRSKGSAFSTLRRAVMDTRGASVDARVMASLSSETQAALLEVVEPERFYPTPPLIDYLRAYAEGDPSLIERLGEVLVNRTLPELFSSLQVERSPHTMLRTVEPLFHRLHTWGRFGFERKTTDSSIVRFDLSRRLAPEMCRLMTGTLREVVRFVRQNVRVVQTSCVSKGATACEFVVTWSAD